MRNNKCTKSFKYFFLFKTKNYPIEVIKEKHLSNLSNELLKVVFPRISNLLIYTMCATQH